MKFALIAHPDKYTVAPSLKEVLTWCEANRVACFARKDVYETGGLQSGKLFTVVNDDTRAVHNADVAIAIGGDGMMLYTAQITLGLDIPVLGINCGRLGFMANIQQDQIEESLETVLEGDFRIDERFMLRADLNNDKTYHALNEFLFTKKDTISLVTLTASYDEQYINTYWADGLIIASPTGSTAYNLSSGGPIVMPGIPVMVLTPINPHTLTTRPLILPSHKTLTIRVEENADHILFSHDGKIMEIKNQPFEVRIRRSEHSVKLIQLMGQSYFDTLRNKLMWGMDYRKRS